MASKLLVHYPDFAVVKYDQFFFETLRSTRDGHDPDAPEFALAYDLMNGVVTQLLAHRRSVIIESTFTRVTLSDRSLPSVYVHQEEMERLLQFNPQDTLVFQLYASWEKVSSRLKRTQRLADWVVEGTWEAHREPWPGCYRISTDAGSTAAANKIATTIRGAL